MLNADDIAPGVLAIQVDDGGALVEEVQQAARRDIARELHDTVIQPLTSLAMSFETVRHQPLTEGMVEAYLGAWKELAQEALDSLRHTLAGMHTHPHAALGLVDALQRYLAPQVRSRGLRLAIECQDWPAELPLDWTSTLYLVLREALTNVEKHAHATEVTVLLRADREQLHMIVTDNGVGFAAGEGFRKATGQAGTGLGLAGMRERVGALGGALSIMTADGGGVHLEARIPHGRHS